MKKYLIDENLPYFFNIWREEKFIHVFDIDDCLTDKDIWEFAKERNLIIVTKDADFSHKILYNPPPPKVIHLRIGNMKIRELYDFLTTNWPLIEAISESHKLTNVYQDRVEGIE